MRGELHTDLRTSLREYVEACFTAVWIESHEQEDALLDIAGLCRDEDWRLATWDIDQGLRSSGVELDASDPLAAIRAVDALASSEGTTLLVLRNFHRFLPSAEIVQAVERQIIRGKQNRTILIVLAPTVQVPIELERQFVMLEHSLPSREQLEQIAHGVATEEGELPEGVDLERVLDAASGLTRMEAENAFALSLVRHGRIDPASIWELKTQALRTSGLLSLHRGEEGFEQLGGLDNLKSFCRRALRPRPRGSTSVRSRGVLLLGVPGTGKSAFAKALGHETGRPTLTLDVGSLLGSLVGQSEERTRRALEIVDAMQPAVLFIDEVEKALGGAASGGQGDSGVSSRMFASLLSWLNDHTSDVFVVCTANDVTRLPPEFSRSERFDSIVFLDLPGHEQKEAIWKLYRGMFEIDPDQQQPDDSQWTGAEIKSCCRLSALLDVPLVQAAQNVVPVAITAAESVERLRSWADGRCLSADEPGVYRHEKRTSKTRRNVARDPLNN